MGNSASTEQQQQQTKLADQPSQDSIRRLSHYLSSEGEQDKPNTKPNEPFQFSITEPQSSPRISNTMTNPMSTTTTEETSAKPSGWTSNTNHHHGNDTTSSPKPVPGKSGWVSSTGASSPWYGGGSLSSSASSSHQPPQQQQNIQHSYRSHRQSISGPYYRARGMSVNQQQEPAEEDLIASSASSYQQPSPSVSTSHHQLPRLQLQQLQLNSPSPSSPTAKNEMPLKDKLQNEATGVPTIITWSQGGNSVYVTGTFNGWKHKIKLVQSTHDFSTVIDLPHGTHRLKFIVDDEWKCSNDMETATDPDGNLVNYLQVMDEDSMEDELGHDALFDTSNGGLTTPTEEYTSVIPKELLLLSEALADNESMDAHQKKAAIDWERQQPQPPSLPPHLEKVLLNSQAVSDEDNSVLPVPNHVTLNHLYACSIKDHVMALSTTTRYRKKYVTTMYYRPVQ